MAATQVSIDGWIDGWMDHVISLSTRWTISLKKRILTHTTTWINLEHTMLNEINLAQKRQPLTDSTNTRSPSGQTHRDKKQDGSAIAREEIGVDV